jgi:hypothetical protein
MWGRGIRKLLFEIFGRCKTFTWGVKERNEKINMYFTCDLNGRWLKESNFICCIDVLLIVEGRVVSVIKVGSFFELVYLHFF